MIGCSPLRTLKPEEQRAHPAGARLRVDLDEAGKGATHRRAKPRLRSKRPTPSGRARAEQRPEVVLEAQRRDLWQVGWAPGTPSLFATPPRRYTGRACDAPAAGPAMRSRHRPGECDRSPNKPAPRAGRRKNRKLRG